MGSGGRGLTKSETPGVEPSSRANPMFAQEHEATGIARDKCSCCLNAYTSAVEPNAGDQDCTFGKHLPLPLAASDLGTMSSPGSLH